jgi:type II secretory ATPase GspE/PulE/Tfp pilus assembly ATPase PilB-like protein
MSTASGPRSSGVARRLPLGESLVEEGFITRTQLEEALRRRLTSGERIGEALVALGYITERDLMRRLAGDAGIPFLEAADLRVDPEVVSTIPAAVAVAQNAMPIRMDGRALIVAMSNPFDLQTVRAVERAAARVVRAVGADPMEVSRLIETFYGGTPGGPRQDARSSRDGTVAPENPKSSLVSVEEGATAAQLAEGMIKRGVTLGATDIHIEPLEDSVQVRYRVDGMLQIGPVYPKNLQAALVSRIKILAGLDIAESRLPQDGRVRSKFDSRPIDLRVSTFPTVHGEDIVLRILDRGRVTLKLEALGVDPSDLSLLREALARPFGIIPVTGPTGSGKTTTLYSALLEMNTGERCLITLEDPVEYEVEKIRQSQINVRAGLTFASGLRSILRHDPDVILVGEMRDQETVQIALSAALTGHLVLTTLHTTTAAGAIPRLLDMGAEPFIVASAITLVASQRLIRTLCGDCKAPLELNAAIRERFDLPGTVYQQVGCPACRNTGYRGRIGIFEFLPISEEIVPCIYERRSSEDIRRVSNRPTLLDDGMRKVRAGTTTLDEVLRVIA